MKNAIIILLFFASISFSWNWNRFITHSPHWLEKHTLGVEFGFSPHPRTYQLGYSCFNQGLGLSFRYGFKALAPSEDPYPRPEWTFRVRDQALELAAGLLLYDRFYLEFALVDWRSRYINHRDKRVAAGYGLKILFQDHYFTVRWNDIYRWSFGMGIWFK